MDSIDGFWVGAARHGRGVDLRSLAERAGGFAALQRGGLRGLIDLGVEPERARAWARTPGLRTRGRGLTPADPDYPRRLLGTPDPPPFLCVLGDLSCLRRPTVGIVGTRGCTAYGTGVARRLGSALASAGVAVVSGLARGIDGHAHRATLGLGSTVAVFGHGLDHTAPRRHQGLRERILDEGGLVVSAFPDDLRPAPGLFPQRNAWIAGLSDRLVVVEAPRRSGALITATYMADLDRPIHVVPGQLGAPASRGCLALVGRPGVELITDVEQFVGGVVGLQPPAFDDWLEHLFAGHPVDEVARAAGRDTAELLAEITRRELRGEVVRLPGGRYAPGSPCARGPG